MVAVHSEFKPSHFYLRQILLLSMFWNHINLVLIQSGNTLKGSRMDPFHRSLRKDDVDKSFRPNAMRNYRDSRDIYVNYPVCNIFSDFVK